MEILLILFCLSFLFNLFQFGENQRIKDKNDYIVNRLLSEVEQSEYWKNMYKTEIKRGIDYKFGLSYRSNKK